MFIVLIDLPGLNVSISLLKLAFEFKVLIDLFGLVIFILFAFLFSFNISFFLLILEFLDDIGFCLKLFEYAFVLTFVLFSTFLFRLESLF